MTTIGFFDMIDGAEQTFEDAQWGWYCELIQVAEGFVAVVHPWNDRCVDPEDFVDDYAFFFPTREGFDVWNKH